jgi:hypothetical protein
MLMLARLQKKRFSTVLVCGHDSGLDECYWVEFHPMMMLVM